MIEWEVHRGDCQYCGVGTYTTCIRCDHWVCKPHRDKHEMAHITERALASDSTRPVQLELPFLAPASDIGDHQ